MCKENAFGICGLTCIKGFGLKDAFPPSIPVADVPTVLCLCEPY